MVAAETYVGADPQRADCADFAPRQQPDQGPNAIIRRLMIGLRCFCRFNK